MGLICTFERNFTLPPFKVTQGPRKWHKSIGYLNFLLAVHSSVGTGSSGHRSPGQRFWPGRVWCVTDRCFYCFAPFSPMRYRSEFGSSNSDGDGISGVEQKTGSARVLASWQLACPIWLLLVRRHEHRCRDQPEKLIAYFPVLSGKQPCAIQHSQLLFSARLA